VYVDDHLRPRVPPLAIEERMGQFEALMTDVSSVLEEKGRDVLPSPMPYTSTTGLETPAATVVVAQREASTALATRSNLSARTIRQGNHTAIITRCTSPPHPWSGASGGITRAKVATNNTTIAMPLASA
jgi:hypothetical protein